MQSPDRLAVTGPAADPSYLLRGNTPTRMMDTMDRHYAAAAAAPATACKCVSRREINQSNHVICMQQLTLTR